jgi:hypothetical protein
MRQFLLALTMVNGMAVRLASFLLKDAIPLWTVIG